MRKPWRWAVHLLVACLLLGLTACGTPTEEGSAPGTTTVTTSTATTTTTTKPTTTTTTAPPLGYNVLTGVNDLETKSNRPVAVVVSDESSKMTQLGLESADFYFEAETEAGIPRILAVYASVDRLPAAIGPVRSARPHFVKIAHALDAVYCHIGGSKSGKQAIRDLGVEDLQNAFIIHDVLKNSSNFSWNRSAFTQKKVAADMKRYGYATTSSLVSPFTFGEVTGTQSAETVDVKISESYNIAFTYNEKTGLYEKHRNSLDTPIHHTHTGGPIAVSNVLVMFDRRTVDQVEQTANGGTMTRFNFDLKSGSGLLASGGTARPIRWRFTDEGMTFYENDGTTHLTVATGKTFLCLASKTLENKTKVY